MVGMSGKGSEPRRGHSTQTKKTAPGSTSKAAQPPPEALHVANILGDRYPADLSEKVKQVMLMLPSCREEEICTALHDHDFDTDKAVSALLDSDPSTRGQVILGLYCIPSICMFLMYIEFYSSISSDLSDGLKVFFGQICFKTPSFY